MQTAICRLLIALLPLFFWGCSSDSTSQLVNPFTGDSGSNSTPQTSLTVTASIETSSVLEALATIDPPKEIILTFSEPLNMETVRGNVRLQTVKTGSALVSPTPEFEVVADPQQASRLIMRSVNGSNLVSGEEYRLTVGTGLHALSGNSLAEEYVRFFATDYQFVRTSLTELDNTRTVTVVISDIHLGDQRSIKDGYGWTVKNREKLVNFLTMLRQRPHIKELVIVGDFFDEWVAPMEQDTFGGATQSGFADAIVSANRPIIDAFNAIIKDGQIKVTYVPGNHDMLVTSADFQRIFPGINQARDASGLGAYTPNDMSGAVFEHGHRYDFFNAPDTYSNREITKTDSMLPPGFFVTKIAATSDIEKGQQQFYRESLTSLYDSANLTYYRTYLWAWKAIMSQKPVKESWDAKIIKTGVDGYTATYAINDLVPRQESSDGVALDVLLYKDIVTNWWNKRQTANQVPEKILAEVAMVAGAWNPALDDQAVWQYFAPLGTNRRIVVFGHTHEAKLKKLLNSRMKWSIYANSGTWVDTNKTPTCTFVSIIPQKGNGATTDTVTVYQYIDDVTFKKIGSSAIRN